MNKDSKHLKIIAVTSMLTFSLVTAFVASFAWFTAANNTNVDGNGFVATQMDSIVEKVEFHKMSDNEYTYDKTAALTYTMDKSNGKEYTYTIDGDSSVAIGQYSTFGKKQSLLVLYKFRDNLIEDEYKFTLKATTTITNFSKTVLGSDGTIASTGNSLSNVIQFYALSYAEGGSLPEDSTSTYYDFSSNRDAIEGSNLKFVTFENNTAELSNTTLNLASNNGDDAKKIKYVAVILTYNQEAVEQIYTKYIGSSILGSGSISFSSDFKLVI